MSEQTMRDVKQCMSDLLTRNRVQSARRRWDHSNLGKTGKAQSSPHRRLAQWRLAQ